MSESSTGRYRKQRKAWHCNSECKCNTCGGRFDEQDTVSCAIQLGADPELCCPKCHSDDWELI